MIGNGNGRDAAEVTERDLAIFRERLAGNSPTAITKLFMCTLDDIDAAIDRVCRPLTAKDRMRIFLLELHRLDELTACYREEALNGNAQAAAVMIKISERRAMMLGYDAPTRVDAVQIKVTEEEPSSLEKIKQALDFVVSQRPKAVTDQSEEEKKPDGNDQSIN
jgi:hypothetical protein